MGKYILLILIIFVIIYLYYKNIDHFNYITKPILKLKLKSKIWFSRRKERFEFQSDQQFIDYFLPNKYNYNIIENDEKSDITIWDIDLEDNSELRNDEINILICVENVPHWNYYKHYTKYSNYNDNKIKIYLYNHIDKIDKTDKYLSVPLIHNYINYFNNNNLNIQPNTYTLFNNKKFCLMINKSKLNSQINETVTELEKIGEIDSLSMYPELLDKSCYHSVELLNVFNKYKFVLCFENSYADGYITEKIFNCFFAKTIPIYKGSEKISKYINKFSYIDARSNYIDQILLIKDNENLYNTYINSNKIEYDYDDENYNNQIIQMIESNFN